MTKEEKQQIKEREKEYIGLFKQIAKKYEMKYKANTLFFTHKDYFIKILYDFSVENNNIMYSATIKYMVYDDIQWDILDMADNKKEPLSLRATGAFSAFGYKLIPAYKVVSLEDNPERVLNNVLSEIKKLVENFNEDIDSKVLDMLGEKEEDKMEAVSAVFIVYIHQKEYKKARELIEKCMENGYEGSFGNNGKMFVELALEYLNKNNL